jgi:hypothetical protein
MICRTLLLLAALIAPAAHASQAAGASLRLSVEVSSRFSFEVSSAASSHGSHEHHGGHRHEAEESYEAQAPQAQPVSEEPVQEQACSARSPCRQDLQCVEGQCVAPPEAKSPDTKLLRRGSELYVRDHAAQLRQDLALGEGPVIVTLASLEQVPPATLGRLLRTHHRELSPLIGDAADSEWPAKFLRKVDALRGSSRS